MWTDEVQAIHLKTRLVVQQSQQIATGEQEESPIFEIRLTSNDASLSATQSREF